MSNLMRSLWKEESGQGMAEYGLILALVAVICIAAFTALGKGINNQVNKVGNTISNPESAGSSGGG
ncbi:MAG: Flp family type IVb pilin [Peptococcaceae bacterium]|nr:Flp family type IVb pilin [Peptococcaceae bacterium]